MKRSGYSSNTRRRRRARRKVSLTPTFTSRLKKEAQALGMNVHEYVDVVLSFSGSLRKALNLGENTDVSQYLRLVNHPMFSLLMQWVVQTAMSAASDTEEENTNKQPEAPVGLPRVPDRTLPPQVGIPRAPQAYPVQPYPSGQAMLPPAPPVHNPPWQYW